MKKFTISLLVLLLAFTITGCTNPEEVENALDTYCENNAESTLCTNPDASRDVVVSDMMNTIMAKFVDGTNATFCEDYFAHEGLIEQCQNDRYNLVPQDVLSLSGNLTINAAGNSSDFEIFNECNTGDTCYRFDVSVIEMDGIVKFTNFEYVELNNDEEPGNEIGLTLDEVKMFVHYTINANVNNHTCDDRFTGNALTECEGDFSNMAPSYLMNNYVTVKTGVNTYTVTADSFSGYEKVVYTVTFTGTLDEYRISELSYQLVDSFNTKAHLDIQLELFKNDYNSPNKNLYETCDYYAISEDVDACLNFFDDVKTVDITTISTVEDSGTLYATITFEDATELEMEVEIISSGNGMYKLDFTFDDSIVVDPGDDLGLTVADVLEKMKYVIEYTDTTPCTWDFIDPALSECNTSSIGDILAPSHISYDATAVAIGTNQFTYTVNSEDLLQTVVYTVLFGGTKDDLFVKQISYVLTENFDTKDTALDLFREFKNQFNDTTISLTEACTAAVVAEDINGCVSFFDAVKNEEITMYDVLDEPGNEYIFSVQFSNNLEWYDLSFMIEQVEPSVYLMDMNFDPELIYVRDINDETVLMFFTKLYEDYYEDNAIECSNYFVDLNNLVTLCNNDTIGIFSDVEPDDINLDGNDSIYSVTLYRLYEDGSYGMIYPNYNAIMSYSSGRIKISTIELADIPTLQEVSDVTTEFEVDIVDASISNTTFCNSIGHAGPTCETFRQSVLDGTNISIEYQEDTNDLGEVIVVMIYDVDGVQTAIEVLLGTEYAYQNNTPISLGFRIIDPSITSGGDTGTCDPCDCEVCVDQDCDGLITSEVLLGEFFEMFFRDYNDSTMTNDTFSSKYNIGTTSTMMTERSDVIGSGGVTLQSVEVEYVNDEYDSVTITYQLVLNGNVYIDVNILDVFVETSTTFSFTEDLYERRDGVNESDAYAIFEQYLLDYMDPSMDNATVSNKYFGIPDSPHLNDRFTFFTSNGSLELVNVLNDNGVYRGIYKETLNGVTTTYSQTFTPYRNDQNIVMFEFETKIISEPVVTPSSETEGYILAQQFIADLTDETITDEQICNMYYEGVVDCVNRLLFTMNEVYLNGVTFIEQDEQQTFTMDLEVISTMSFRDVIWTIKLSSKSDGTYLVEEVSMVLTHNFKYMVYNELELNEEETRMEIRNYHNDYFDPTISSTDFCNQYTPFTDEIYMGHCIDNRDQIIASGSVYNIESIAFKYKYYSQIDPALAQPTQVYQFIVTTSGRDSEYTTEDLFYQLIYDIMILEDGSHFIYMANQTIPYDVTKEYFTGTIVLPILTSYLDPTVLTSDICDEITNADDTRTHCAVDRNFFMGIYNPVDVTRLITSYNLVQGTSTINPATQIGELIIVNVDIGNGYNKAIVIPISVYKYSSTYRPFYLNQTDSMTEEEFESFISIFLSQYTDSSISDATFAQSYTHNLDRASDLGVLMDWAILDVYVDRYSAAYPYYYFIIEYGPTESREIRMIRIESLNVFETQASMTFNTSYISYIYE